TRRSCARRARRRRAGGARMRKPAGPARPLRRGPRPRRARRATCGPLHSGAWVTSVSRTIPPSTRRRHTALTNGEAREINGMTLAELKIKDRAECRWDLVSLGEVMLRLDPGEGRVHTTRSFQVWEGGGEYNVARGLKRCFGLETAVVTALVDNPVGRLVQDLIYQGGVDQSHVVWVADDGVGRQARNGLNFTERGFGVRAALGCSDRGHTAVSQLKPGQIDWEQIFGGEGARWLHTGGIFAALSETTPFVAKEAME